MGKIKFVDGFGCCPNVTVFAAKLQFFPYNKSSTGPNFDENKILYSHRAVRGTILPVLNFHKSTDLAGINIYQVFISSFIAWLILSRAVLLEYSPLGEARAGINILYIFCHTLS